MAHRAQISGQGSSQGVGTGMAELWGTQNTPSRGASAQQSLCATFPARDILLGPVSRSAPNQTGTEHGQGGGKQHLRAPVLVLFSCEISVFVCPFCWSPITLHWHKGAAKQQVFIAQIQSDTEHRKLGRCWVQPWEGAWGSCWHGSPGSL